MAGQTVVISVLADTKQFSKDFGDAADRAGGLGKVFGVAAAGIGIAALAVGGFVAASIKAAGESEKVAAQTAAVVKSTGEAAGKSADQIGQLATKLSRLTGIDDEVVQGGENILLTFTNIKGTSFDAATKSALDMSVAMGTDLNSAALSVGKALNDPIAGITKLTKQGVTFTEQQKEQIATLQKSGDVAGAQAIILAELQKEFGGSAEAFGNTFEGALGKVKTEFGNLQETIGGAFLPVLTTVLTKVADLFSKITDSPAFTQIVNNIAAFVGSLLDGNSAIGNFAGTIAQLAGFFSPLGLVLKVVGPLLPQIGAAFATIGKTLLSSLAPALPPLVDGLQSVVKVMSGVLAAVLPVVISLVLTLVKTLAPLIAQILPPLAAVFATVANIIATAVVPIIQQLAPLISSLVTAIVPVIASVLGLVAPLLNLLIPVLNAVLPPVLAIVSALVTYLVPIITTVADLVGGLLTVVFDSLGGTITIIGDLLRGDFSGALKDTQKTFGKVWGDITSTFSKVYQDISSGIQGMIGFFTDLGKNIFNALVGFDTLLINTGKNLIQGLINGIQGAVGGVLSFVKDIGTNIAKAFSKALGIHSPSTVFKSLGRYTIQGLELGLSAPNNIASIMSGVSGQITGGYGAGLDAAPGYAVAGAGSGMTVNVTLTGAVVDPLGAARQIKGLLDDYSRFGGQA